MTPLIDSITGAPCHGYHIDLDPPIDISSVEVSHDLVTVFGVNGKVLSVDQLRHPGAGLGVEIPDYVEYTSYSV